MKKTKELNQLFEDWRSKHKFEIFCEDGIVDEEIYNGQKTKILFVLNR